MQRYDPKTPPNPRAWLALSESRRLALVTRYHKVKRIPLPNLTLHATFHTIVENQMALDPKGPVAATVLRLMTEGVARHQALHAIASVLVKHLHTLAHAPDGPDDEPPPPAETPAPDTNSAYIAALEGLTADGWRTP